MNAGATKTAQVPFSYLLPIASTFQEFVVDILTICIEH